MTNGEREKQLIEQALSGSSDAFSELVRPCHSKAYAVAFRYMRNEQDASDALQEAYIKLFTKLHTFAHQSRFETWLIRIVINCCYDALRKQKKDRTVGGEAAEALIEQTGIENTRSDEVPETAALQSERQRMLKRAMACMAKDHRDVLILREYEQFSYEEIARILLISPGTVKSRIHRAKQALRDILMEQNPEFFV